MESEPPKTIFHFKGSFRMSILNMRALKGTVKINADAFSDPSLEAAIKNAVVAKAMAPTDTDKRFNQKIISRSNTESNCDVSTKNKARTELSRYSQKL
jgi:hypothetical protein